ncbi:hypothetical protein ACFPM7_02690 [Actinokineospora guangxiensis]|uniref:Uncharacterized protein n=1 Tax=Actinokineospora guangxiensis TaxID=1490288 RepID=A0ABW0EIC1_9PSEU
MTEQPGDYSEAGVPSFDFVRNKIEGRHATSVGSSELAEATPEAADVNTTMAERDKAGADRLEQIRKAMRGE